MGRAVSVSIILTITIEIIPLSGFNRRKTTVCGDYYLHRFYHLLKAMQFHLRRDCTSRIVVGLSWKLIGSCQCRFVFFISTISLSYYSSFNIAIPFNIPKSSLAASIPAYIDSLSCILRSISTARI